MANQEEQIILNSDEEDTMSTAENENCCDDGNLMSSPVLSNGVILDMVFAKLDTPSLKSVRLVCHIWNDLASRPLGKKTRLVLKKMFPSGSAMLAEAPQINQKLVKHIHVDERHQEQKLSKISFGQNFALLVPSFCDVVEKLVIRVDGNFIPHLLDALNQKDFLKLKEISIEYNQLGLDMSAVTQDGGYYVTTSSHPLPTLRLNFRPLPSLKRFTFKSGENGISVMWCQMYDAAGCFVFRSLFQAVLGAAAKNLEELEFADRFCPNLSACTSLKVLKYRHQFHRKDGTINIAAVQKILMPVKNSLEKLELDFEFSNLNAVSRVMPANVDHEAPFIRVLVLLPPQEPSDILRLPEMPNLTSLTFREVNQARLENVLDKGRLPQVTSLTLLDERWFRMSLDKIQRSLGIRNELITSLHLGLSFTAMPGSFPILSHLIQLFPSVKNFRMGFDLKYLTPKAKLLSRLTEIVTTFHSCGLEKVDLNFSGVEIELIPDLVELLTIVEELKSVTFSMRNNGNSLILSSVSDEVMVALMACARLECVIISLAKTDKDVENELEAFILEHGLPIELQWDTIPSSP